VALNLPRSADELPRNRPAKVPDNGPSNRLSLVPRIPRVPVVDVSHLMPAMLGEQFAGKELSRQGEGLCYKLKNECHVLYTLLLDQDCVACTRGKASAAVMIGRR
jgi:hypothetical protein